MNYRTLLASSLVLFLHATASSQASLSSLHAVTIRFRHTGKNLGTPSDNTLLFSHFEVIDLRPDTCRIGIHTSIPDFGRNHDRQLVFTRSAAGEIAAYLNSRFARPGAPYTALVILRTLWLSDANYLREDLIRDPDRRFERTHIRLKAEIYAIRDSQYRPLLRFDTLQIAWKRRILRERSAYFEWGVNLTLLMNEMADSISRIAARSTAGNRWVGLEDIRHFNATRFETPISGNTLNRGVYASFEEFRNNSPSIQDFEIRVENNQRLLYIRESGQSYYSHDAWGYCDGKDIFIMRDGVLYPAWKEEKAFYIPTGAVSGNNLVLTRRRDYTQLSIYSVDMDTGDIY